MFERDSKAWPIVRSFFVTTQDPRKWPAARLTAAAYTHCDARHCPTKVCPCSASQLDSLLTSDASAAANHRIRRVIFVRRKNTSRYIAAKFRQPKIRLKIKLRRAEMFRNHSNYEDFQLEWTLHGQMIRTNTSMRVCTSTFSRADYY
jgi:hypothetical protein